MERLVSSGWESNRGPRQVGHRLGEDSKRERQSRQRVGMIFGSVGDFEGFGNGCVTGGGNTRDMGCKLLIWLGWGVLLRGF
jgi:hypothetical protein